MHSPLSKGFLPFFPSASALENKPASAKNRDRTATQFLTLLLRPKNYDGKNNYALQTVGYKLCLQMEECLEGLHLHNTFSPIHKQQD